MMLYKIVLGHIVGGFGERFETDFTLLFISKEKRDLFYNALGGENKQGYGGMDLTYQHNFGKKNTWGYVSYSDHMNKIDPKTYNKEQLFDDYDLSKIIIRR